MPASLAAGGATDNACFVRGLMSGASAPNLKS
jgi:hypothetical protein